MDIDTHVHLLVSKTAAPDWDEVAHTMNVASMEKLDALCIAEHLDAVHYGHLLNGIFADLRLGGELLAPGLLRLENGLILSSAAEVALRGGGDVGVHASPDVLMSLEKMKGYYSLDELVTALSDRGEEIVMVAHHMYWNNKWIEGIGGKVHAVELPAKDLDNAASYDALAKAAACPLIGGSDAHAWPQLGVCRTRLNVTTDGTFTRSLLKAALQQGAVAPVSIGDAARSVRLSGLLRRRLEERSAAPLH